MGRKAVVSTEQAELFSFETVSEVASETEVSANSVTEVAPVETSVEPEIETETEIDGPSDAEMARFIRSSELDDIVNSGYSHDEWTNVMLATDTHTVGMSRGVAVERVFIAKQAAKRSRQFDKETARITRMIETGRGRDAIRASKETELYGAMSALLPGLRSRAVVLSLTEETVTVSALTWVKGKGREIEPVATFTMENGRYMLRVIGGSFKAHTLASAVTALTEELPERVNIVPAKYRDVMRTHRHKNGTPTDITGDRATRNAMPESDTLSAADIAAYPALAMVQGPKLKTSGKVSMQGVALTASERRESDRARLKAWREAKRAEKLAAAQAETA